MKNINLTYVYEESKSITESDIPNKIAVIYGIIIIILIPFIFFKIEGIELKQYDEFFKENWFNRIIIYLIITQVLSLFNPFMEKTKSNEEDKSKYKKISLKFFFLKLSVLAFFCILFWIFH